MSRNWIEIVVGFLALGYGVYSLYVRITDPERIGKLASMKRVYGAKAGAVIHLVMYSIIPIAFGLVLIASGFFGIDIFGK